MNMSNIQIEQKLIEAIKVHCKACPKTDPNDLLAACKYQCAEIDEVLSNIMLMTRGKIS
ncbi:hypothetical protein [Terasakiella sp. SH-1]|uniref:hypothetical protein n=1 Tax=Terasakiella sp. SH-1 TaxID=2560057 RepID=UPI0014312737|nr:hypothetical protein [Terasakiella sp. SH-1]